MNKVCGKPLSSLHCPIHAWRMRGIEKAPSPTPGIINSRQLKSYLDEV